MPLATKQKACAGAAQFASTLMAMAGQGGKELLDR